MAKKKSKLNNLNILLGVTGSIAAYKAVDLASKLTAAGAKVTTVMTENACRFIQPASFQAITARPVHISLWIQPDDLEIKHISLAELADLVIVAPATANIIAKIAAGICDDLLSTTLAACWKKPTLLAPAMNNNMWTSPATQKNVKILKQSKYQFVGPETGRLACGPEAVGRMSEPADILNAIENIAEKTKTY